MDHTPTTQPNLEVAAAETAALARQRRKLYRLKYATFTAGMVVAAVLAILTTLKAIKHGPHVDVGDIVVILLLAVTSGYLARRVDEEWNGHKTTEPAEAAEDAESTAAYRDLTHLLAYHAARHPSVLAAAGNDRSMPDCPVLYLDTPAGQLSWTIRPEHTDLLAGVEQVAADDSRAEWDGHDTAERHQRLAELAAISD